jgi:hypothetical protein
MRVRTWLSRLSTRSATLATSSGQNTQEVRGLRICLGSPLPRKLSNCAAAPSGCREYIIANVGNPTHCDCVNWRYYSLSLKPKSEMRPDIG